MNQLLMSFFDVLFISIELIMMAVVISSFNVKRINGWLLAISLIALAVLIHIISSISDGDQFIKICVNMALMTAWSLLCFIPGIIAGLRYSQAFFILAENPEKGIRQCVNESKVLMSGRLWEFFVLQLSFIPWLILTSITCGIAGLYVTPYTTITYAGYYLSLKPPVESHRSYADGQDSEQ